MKMQNLISPVQQQRRLLGLFQDKKFFVISETKFVFIRSLLDGMRKKLFITRHKNLINKEIGHFDVIF